MTILQSNISPDTSLPSPQPATPLHEPGQASAGSIDVSHHERQGLGPAMDYIRRIKARFSNDPDIYKQFLEILASHKSSADNAEVFAKVEELFKDAPDLVFAFRDFLPGTGGTPDSDSLGMLRGPSTRSSNTRRGRVGRICAKL